MEKLLVIDNKSDGLIRVSPDEIMYIKSDGNYCLAKLYGRDKLIQIWESLKDMESLIKEQMRAERPRLVRTGKQFILNIDYISVINTSKDTLSLWRKGMTESITIKELSHKALASLLAALQTKE